MNELILLEDLGMLYPTEKSKEKKRFGLYRCFCGEKFETMIQSVKNNKTTSCGCHNRKRASETKTTHNLSKHILYGTWDSMVQRCYNIKNKKYKDYGGRGITVCDEWKNATNFIEDMYPSYVEGLTLDRINVNGNYQPSNCRWATREIQNRNTRLLQSNNKSGYRGVSFHKKSNKWRTQVVVNKKVIHLGTFDNPLDGALTYDNYVALHNLEHTKNFT